MDVVSRLAQLRSIAAAGKPGVMVDGKLGANRPLRSMLSGRPVARQSLSINQQPQPRLANHGTHWNAATVTTVELEALHKTSVGQPLQASLGRRDRPVAIEASMQLTT